ncbi:hypothetical protein Tco_1124467 [Tanacetum coccineum]|uniref:Xylulose kinase-1 n=1 Tax=Tanacetum coccineum TaxID=301880 RepID=A0ABQ5J677_9ASTR
MAALESCPKHNMIAYLEKTEGNVEFHEVIDFLRRSYIYHALTVSPVVSTTFVEQFWTSAKSKTINNVRHITAKVAGKVVSISEASIRTDLIFDDADGIDSLPNQAIFDAIQLMGYEGDLTVLTFNKALFSPQWRHSPTHFTPRSICSDSIPELLVSDQAKEIKLLKAKITTLKKQAKPVIKHHTAYLKSLSLQQRFPRKSFSKKHRVHKKYENAQSEGRTRELVDEDKELDEDRLSTEDGVSTDKERVSTDFEKSASKEKEKGVELKDVEEIDRPRPTSQRSLLTLKPLPKIDPKDKGKKKIEEEDESESEDDDIPQAVKKFKQLESDEEMARKIQEEWEAEEVRNKIAEEKATNEALIKNFDDIKARIEADRILAEKLQEQEREQFTIEERAKFLQDTIATQSKFLAQVKIMRPSENRL